MALPVCSDMATRMTRYSAAGGFAGAGSARLGPGRQLPRRRRVVLADVRRVLPRRAVYDNDTLIFIVNPEAIHLGTIEAGGGGLIVVNEVDGLVAVVGDTVALPVLTSFEARLLAAELVLLADRIDVTSLLRRIEDAAKVGRPRRPPSDRPESGGPCTCAGPVS